jgi:hypothetical protein
MIGDGMFDGEPPSFDSIVSRLDKLAKEINARSPQQQGAAT